MPWFLFFFINLENYQNMYYSRFPPYHTDSFGFTPNSIPKNGFKKRYYYVYFGIELIKYFSKLKRVLV